MSKRLKVLLVDDEPSTSGRVLDDILTNLGHEHDLAQNRSAALEYLDTGVHDVMVLTDPFEGDTLEFIAMLRDAGKMIPIVMIMRERDVARSTELTDPTGARWVDNLDHITTTPDAFDCAMTHVIEQGVVVGGT